MARSTADETWCGVGLDAGRRGWRSILTAFLAAIASSRSTWRGVAWTFGVSLRFGTRLAGGGVLDLVRRGGVLAIGLLPLGHFGYLQNK